MRKALGNPQMPRAAGTQTGTLMVGEEVLREVEGGMTLKLCLKDMCRYLESCRGG